MIGLDLPGGQMPMFVRLYHLNTEYLLLICSGRTVEDLVESIMDLHITSCSSEDPDKKISENTLREAFSQVEDNLQSKVDREKQKLAAIAITGEGSAHGKGSFALQAQAAVGANIDEAGQEQAAALMSQAELDTYLAAIETIDKMKKVSH